MTVSAPIIVAEMADWTSLGGANFGIVGNKAHTYGFHLGATDVPADDYSRRRDPNGSDGPFVDWSFACAGDFAHSNDAKLRAMHRDVLARLMRGELPMICEFIGKPWADQPVYYWARWNGVATLQRYTGSGHDTWSHISWYRSKVDQRAHLWIPGSTPPPSEPTPTTRTLRLGQTGTDVRRLQEFFRTNFPAYREYVRYKRNELITTDGMFGGQTESWVKEFQRRVGIVQDGVVGPVTLGYLRKYGYQY